MIRKVILIIIGSFVVFFAIAHMYMLYVCDVSLAAIEPECKEEIHLVSYADGPDIFKKNQHFQAFSAINKGVDHIHMYRRKDLDAEFCAKNKEILSQKKGAGYWLWKPYVILKTLKQIPENAVVIYMDSGISVATHVANFMNILGEKDILLMHWNEVGNSSVVSVAQAKTLKILGCHDEGCKGAPHAWAALGVYRNTPQTRAFVAKWLKACEIKECLMEHPSDSEDSRYRSHSHDEGILSIVASQSPEIITFTPMEVIWRKFFLWHHRHPHLSYESLIPTYSPKIRRAIKNAYWSWTILIRKYL